MLAHCAGAAKWPRLFTYDTQNMRDTGCARGTGSKTISASGPVVFHGVPGAEFSIPSAVATFDASSVRASGRETCSVCGPHALACELVLPSTVGPVGLPPCSHADPCGKGMRRRPAACDIVARPRDLPGRRRALDHEYSWMNRHGVVQEGGCRRRDRQLHAESRARPCCGTLARFLVDVDAVILQPPLDRSLGKAVFVEDTLARENDGETRLNITQLNAGKVQHAGRRRECQVGAQRGRARWRA